MPFYNEQTYYSPRGSYRLAYASSTLRLWYAYGTNHIFESRFFPFSSCSKFGMNSRMAFLRQAQDNP